MVYYTFPKEFESNGGFGMIPVLRNWVITWKDANGDDYILRLISTSAQDAYKKAREFGAPVDKKWWQFWVNLNVCCVGHSRHHSFYG